MKLITFQEGLFERHYKERILKILRLHGYAKIYTMKSPIEGFVFAFEIKVSGHTISSHPIKYGELLSMDQHDNLEFEIESIIERAIAKISPF